MIKHTFVCMAWWLSWLERRPVTAEVVGSSPIWVVVLQYASDVLWGLSSAGRASALQAEGHRFEPYRSHLFYSYADVAQLAEQLICNQQVIGSSPIIGLHQTVNLNGVCWKTVKLHMGGFPSGQRGQTVNLLQFASVVRIHLRPLHI